MKWLLLFVVATHSAVVQSVSFLYQSEEKFLSKCFVNEKMFFRTKLERSRSPCTTRRYVGTALDLFVTICTRPGRRGARRLT